MDKNEDVLFSDKELESSCASISIDDDRVFDGDVGDFVPELLLLVLPLLRRLLLPLAPFTSGPPTFPPVLPTLPLRLLLLPLELLLPLRLPGLFKEKSRSGGNVVAVRSVARLICECNPRELDAAGVAVKEDVADSIGVPDPPVEAPAPIKKDPLELVTRLLLLPE